MTEQQEVGVPELVRCLREVMDERDRRYEQRFIEQEKAVLLAKQAADAVKGTVNISVIVGIIALILTILEKFK